MADDSEKISTGPNEEPINETIAGTGPGIPDEASRRAKELPQAPSDEEVERWPRSSVADCREATHSAGR